MKLQINVTKRVMKAAMYCGTSKNGHTLGEPVSNNCAIALAMKPLFKSVDVGTEDVTIYRNVFGTGIMLFLPIEAVDFIQEFDGYTEDCDKRLGIEPFSFELDIPNEIIHEIGLSNVMRIISDTPTLCIPKQ